MICVGNLKSAQSLVVVLKWKEAVRFVFPELPDVLLILERGQCSADSRSYEWLLFSFF